MDNRTEPILGESQDHSQLIDLIDELRAQGVNNHIPLPQLIVCGDQSAGKSSLLEAVSGVNFPVKSTACTRFPCELILRRSKDSQTRLRASINPSINRSEREKKKFEDWSVPVSGLEDVPKVIEEAEKVLRVDDKERNFCDDILRIEVTSPTQTNLTLVDLPGLTHADSSKQSNEQIDLVRSLVRRYMKDSRSIILAVVSAQNDYQNQIVTRFARTADPHGLRTLGIITKPDKLDDGSERQDEFVALAQNKDINFRLGWHVLKNRDYREQEYSHERRNQIEEEFFSKGVWSTLPATNVGVGQLKSKLSTVLRDHVAYELSSVIDDVDKGIDRCQKRLNELGDPREDFDEQRGYLAKSFMRYGFIAQAAVSGIYDDEFFGDANEPIGSKKRLRAIVVDLLSKFEKAMQKHGHFRDIAADDDVEEGTNKVSRTEMLKHVQSLMRKTRGRELLGTFNPLIIGDLFLEQAEPWKKIVESWSNAIFKAVNLCVKLIVRHVMDDNTAAAVQRELVHPAIEKCRRQLQEKLSTILQPHQRGHPITYNREFTRAVQEIRAHHEKSRLTGILSRFFKHGLENGGLTFSGKIDMNTLIEALSEPTEGDMEMFACSEAVFYMRAYYKVAMQAFIDDFARFGIEDCLLKPLSGILSPTSVIDLKPDELKAIAGENEETRNERDRVRSKLQVLKKGAETLRSMRNIRVPIEDSIEVESQSTLSYRASRNSSPSRMSVSERPGYATDQDSDSTDGDIVAAQASGALRESAPKSKIRRRSTKVFEQSLPSRNVQEPEVMSDSD